MTEPRISFEFFHPLDHWPWEPRCREFYGGPWHHVKLTWDMRRREQVVKPFHWTFCCTIRRKHHWMIWKKGPLWDSEGNRDRRIREPAAYLAGCQYCRRTRAVTEDECW